MTRIPLSLLITSCAIVSQAQQPTQAPAVNTIQEAKTLLSSLALKPARSYSTRDFGREKYPQAISVVVSESSAPKILSEVRQRLGKGLIAFIGTTRNLDDKAEQGNEIVIANGTDHFDILRVAQSDAANYDMTTDDIIKKLSEYNKLYGIDIFQAETDTIQFKLKKMPKDLKSFSKDLYKFCPDIVDQGTDTIEALQKEIELKGIVYLWWD